jgi:hypothetical protein
VEQQSISVTVNFVEVSGSHTSGRTLNV